MVEHSTARRPTGLQVIGVLKLASGALLGTAGLGVFSLLHKDLGAAADDFISRFHLDPDNRLVQTVAYHVASVDPSHLKAIGAGTLFYAVLHLIEGTGLLLHRRWAEYLTAVITGSLLPLEIYEIFLKFSAIRILVFLVNLSIVVYIVFKLRQEHRARSETLASTSAGR